MNTKRPKSETLEELDKKIDEALFESNFTPENIAELQSNLPPVQPKSEEGCQCEACKQCRQFNYPVHKSDCAVHNEPAERNGECTCKPKSGSIYALIDEIDNNPKITFRERNSFVYYSILSRGAIALRIKNLIRAERLKIYKDILAKHRAPGITWNDVGLWLNKTINQYEKHEE
jgi:hypothetical protein